MKRQLLLTLTIATCAFPQMSLADWKEPDTATGLSGVGAESIAGGTLAIIASPLALSENGLQDSVQQVGSGLGLSALGVVYLSKGGVKGLSELSQNSLEATGVLLSTTGETLKNIHIPYATVEYTNPQGKPVKKALPLVVRPQYVQMNERIDCQAQ